MQKNLKKCSGDSNEKEKDYYTVTNEREANTAFWLISKQKQKIADYQQQYQDGLNQLEKEKEQLDKRLEVAVKGPQNIIDSWENALAIYLMNQQKQNPKYRLKTLNGHAVTRNETSLKQVDSDNLLKRLKGTSYVKNDPKLNWGDYKKTLQVGPDGKVYDENGEAVPEVEATESSKIYFYPEERQ